MSFAAGNTVGPYQIVEQIGQGGMATVFKAYHPNLDRYVAFKVLHPAFKEDSSFLERFKREAQIVAKLEHPSIVPVYDFADLDGQPYLVMKFIEGETLKARLKRQPLTLTETIEILQVVAQALTYAHSKGILHRDIKPSNIMLDTQGTPYIADFGLARIAQAGESTLSQDMMLGTPQYISPEQAKGIQDLGPSTDIYSLGVILYEVVVGRVPFNADTPFAIVHDHIYKPLPMPTQVNPQVPAEVERVLLKALAKDPLDRYASATELVDAFRQGVEAAGMTELSAAQYRPETAGVSSTAATTPPGASSPGSTPIFTGISSPMAVTTGSSASQRAYRRRANLWILGGVGSLLLICLMSMFILVRAVTDKELQPWNITDKADAGAPVQNPGNGPSPNRPGDVFNTQGTITLEEAQQMVANHPDDPVGYLALAVTQFDSGDQEAAIASISQAVTQLDAPEEAIVRAARYATAHDRDELATWFYLETLTQSPISPDIRNEAGDYVYNQIQTHTIATQRILDQFMDRSTVSAHIYTMDALAKLQANRLLSRRQALNRLYASLKLNDSLAETYLARGLYYQAIGQMDKAQADWRYAISFSDTPDWVKREVSRLLNEST